ncbi:flagellar biosynthesis protein FlhA [Caldicellulosiruptor bescii]|uniref:Flagellar biosynthesis protein FlhA n=2 Tax=Caldicellulosiruptor bescii TaxID=31899 RepID=B9MM05_CALBD|nr:flagellar biosynthesis protein FlhA [Caldicellulosiruptor bescii]ACM61228.1 flagellar biosynthesis protein FlhA [Caldicellulosiruptor bescii DSM 6725]PBC88959.1 flagellar biosynthesis protein FlhA [Caldicellulosiruptor bescii]PBC91559.1 flagellar biosynthesis protein FlhA [Caldicellulosiruptor bescii]PBD03028.1 flagellar biosynthesis protein FlhA [Caldicellulosiruptor bescii]PBD07357.1 flagellar biosynthesis protein FlhA [Caldicellulosiruptor bescii]
MNFKGATFSVFAIVIVLSMILPIPPSLLDVLIAVNLSLALVIFLNSINIKEALDFSVFPSLLLFTTLLRLALNISTTRQILTGQGENVRIVYTFGNFVIGSNIVVGVIIFFIIIIIQFIVITRGAERVSEVAARFTLDAMPGKQMAVDADLNAGIITEDEARERRKKIQKEADFYGAMDGASKFVKGDAIAAILITFINALGGLIIGVAMRGEDVTEAIQKYLLLSVGDGIAAQIPALLISTATGIVVTKAADESKLSESLIKQLFEFHPKVLYTVGGILAVLALIPTMPKLSLFFLSGAMFAMGFRMNSSLKKIESIEEKQVEQKEVEELKKPENVVNLLYVDPIEVEFGYGIIPLADKEQGGDLLERVVMIRRQLALELGIIVPTIRLRDNMALKPYEYRINIKGVEVAKAELMSDSLLAINPGFVTEQIEGIPTKEPAFGLDALWIPSSIKERAEMAGYTVVDLPSVIATHLTEIIRRYAHELLTRQDVQKLIDNVKEINPIVVDELIPKLMTVGEVQKVLANLLKERISIRDMVTILETLADWAPTTKDTDILTEYVRQAMSRYITKKYVSGNVLETVTLSPEVEDMIMNSIQKTEQGSFLNLPPDYIQKLINNLSNILEKLVSMSSQPIVICSPIVRIYFRRLIENIFPDVVVLSYNEILPSVQIKTVGMVEV